METKFCKHCQCEHHLTGEFWYFGKGRSAFCKIAQKDYKKANADKIKAYQKEYHKINVDKIKVQHKAYLQDNADIIKKKGKERNKIYYRENAHKRKEYYRDNIDRIKEYNKARNITNASHKKEYNNNYYQANTEAIRDNKKSYYVANKDSINRYKREYVRKRLATDINFKLSYYLRDRLRKAILGNQKAGSAVRDLGCTVPELKQHLESKFQEGMNWENHGMYGWHIDHIIPLASFDLTDREQFLKACHYTNLQPLWAEDNLSKGDKLGLTNDQ